MTGLTITDAIQTYAQDAVALARDHFQTNLDFSENSLEQVEAILSILHKSLSEGISSQQIKSGSFHHQIWQMAKIWGSYLGEVMRRRWGGEWLTETPAHPGTVITLRMQGLDIFPLAKVYKRLVRGSEDNIWHYYQVLILEF